MRVRKLLDWRKLLILKIEQQDRANRWGYYGLHGLDFAFLYRHRPLWDIVAVTLLIGVGVSSVTSAWPAYRRLARHARRLSQTAPSVFPATGRAFDKPDHRLSR